MLGEAHYKLANSLLLDNNISKAISSYKNALSSNPNQLSAANKLAIILATTKNINYQKPKEALAVASRLCQITKNQNPILERKSSNSVSIYLAGYKDISTSSVATSRCTLEAEFNVH